MLLNLRNFMSKGSRIGLVSCLGSHAYVSYMCRHNRLLVYKEWIEDMHKLRALCRRNIQIQISESCSSRCSTALGTPNMVKESSPKRPRSAPPNGSFTPELNPPEDPNKEAEGHISKEESESGVTKTQQDSEIEVSTNVNSEQENSEQIMVMEKESGKQRKSTAASPTLAVSKTNGKRKRDEGSNCTEPPAKAVKLNPEDQVYVRFTEFYCVIRRQLMQEYASLSKNAIYEKAKDMWKGRMEVAGLDDKLLPTTRRRFADIPSTRVCEICLQRGNTQVCKGCKRTLHPTCCEFRKMGKEEKANFCNTCASKSKPCYLCDDQDPKIIHCCVNGCYKKYHEACAAKWQQTRQGVNAKLTCPLHTCHLCISDDSASHNLFVNADNLLRCIFCPTAYHAGEYILFLCYCLNILTV
jgi:hypothetical protein